MSLNKEEVLRGIVAILDGDMLDGDPLVKNSDHGKIGKRPFVCVRAEENDSMWMLLTAKFSEKRLLLDEWKTLGSEIWMSESQYLNDARKTFSGPVDSFVAAGES